MAVAGVLAYAFHILSARTLTTDEYGQIAALWAALFIAVVVLFRPLEQTTSRAVADRLTRGQEATTVLRSVAIVYGCLLVFVGITALFAWGTLTHGLFDGTSFMTAMLVVGIAGYGFQYVVRGMLGGMRRFRGLSGIHVTDGSVRLSSRFPFSPSRRRRPRLPPSRPPAFSARSCRCGALGPRSPASSSARPGSISSFEPRSASPPCRRDRRRRPAAGQRRAVARHRRRRTRRDEAAAVVFAATMLVRVPVFLFSGVAGSILPNLARLNAADDHRRFTSTVTHVCFVFAGATVAIIAVAAAFGPAAMRLVYGPAYHAPASDLALLGLGAGCYLASATISQALLAMDRASRGAVAWAISAALFVCVVVFAPGDDLRRVSLGIALAMAASTLLLSLVFARRARGRTGPKAS